MKKNGKSIYLILIGVVLCLMLLMGCQKYDSLENKDSLLDDDGSNKAIVSSENALANAFLQMSSRNDYDKAFENSRNAKMAIATEPCACGESQICVTQSYVDDALGASDVRECPLDANDIDNLVTEKYAVSKFCLTCQKHTVAFHEKENWIYRERYQEPHDHDAANMGSYDLCQIFSTWQDRKVGYLYKVDGTEKTKVSEFTIDENVNVFEKIFEGIDIWADVPVKRTP